MKITGPVEMINGLGPGRFTLNRPLGPEVITNGGFGADSDWVKGAGWTIAAGVGNCDGSQGGNSDLAQVTSVVSPIIYRVTYTITRTAGNFVVLLGSQSGASRAAAGTYTENIQANATTTKLRGDLNFVGTVDNVSVRRVY